MSNYLAPLNEYSLSRVIDAISSSLSHESKLDASVTEVKQITSDAPRTKRTTAPNKQNIPSQPDSLFWCFYRLAYGAIEYDMAQSSPSKCRMDTLIELSQKVTNQKALLRANKLSAASIAASLGALQFSSNDFVAAVLCMNINTVFIVGNRYLELCNSNDSERHVVSFDDSVNSWVSNSEMKNNEIQNMTKTKLRVQSLDKPLGAVATYTKEQLEVMIEELGIKLPIDAGKKLTKKIMYESIHGYALQ